LQRYFTDATYLRGGNTEVKIIEDTCYGYYSHDSKKFSKPPLKNLSRCLKAEKHDSCVVEPCICASRGRNPENPSDRTTGIDTQQRLEINKQGTSNTLTSVQKDNLVVEPKLVGNIGEINLDKQYQQGNVEKPTYRIRKLTPLECIRLMNFDDEDYQKIKAIGISDSQIYKQCGNSIVVKCLEKIFDKMFIHTDVTEPKQLSLFD
jgi:site-specific DNA-cytosine methylase